ncbi:MAG: MBL fold metallo-hydrolase [Phycisphaerae bacterium]|nr:MBL fold metallo-hydrolase [Phycisphaerae bacterium]
MSLDARVISIGCLSANPLWNERAPTRAGHATTTLIRVRELAILVDPGPAPVALEARLRERTNLGPGAVTHVFLTSFRPDTRRGLPLFGHATWWIGERERETVGVPMAQQLARAHRDGDGELAAALAAEVALLQRFVAAPDRLAPGVDLFPLPGVTPGLCGLLLADGNATTMVCGDAIPTVEHLERGMVLPTAADLDAARESFAEAVEVADALILGRDNLVLNPLRRFDRLALGPGGADAGDGP